jgi:L-alanine-DL-glutamate epimerase-like enolase superfamily enzyme
LDFAFPRFIRYSCGVNLKMTRFDLSLTHTWRIARGVGGEGTRAYPIVLVELTDDQGVTGLGESAPSERYDETVDTVLAGLARIDLQRLSFDDVATSMAYLDGVLKGQDAAKCALNIALLDGAGKRQGKAIYDLFGLGFREKKHLTSFSIGIDQPDIIRRKVQEAEKYPVLKLKVGSPEDLENFAALRSVAPKKPVRVDANEGWKTKEEALRNTEWLHRDGHVEFIEQPMPATSSRADLRWLKERSPLPLFADESYQRVEHIETAAECFHGVNVKLVKTGGITGAYEALQAARKEGLKTMIGCMIESSILISAAAHLAELTNHLDIDGNLLITNDPYLGATADEGVISFTNAREMFGLRVTKR